MKVLIPIKMREVLCLLEPCRSVLPSHNFSPSSHITQGIVLRPSLAMQYRVV